MDIEQLQQKVTELEGMVSKLQSSIEKLARSHADHQHTDSDGTNKLRMGLQKLADSGAPVYIGNGGIIESTNLTTESNTLTLAAGTDTGISKSAAQQSKNTQISIQNLPTSGFIFASCKEYSDSPMSVTSGGFTLTDNNFTWQTNELQNAYINIYDNTGSFIETRQIASNTDHTLTVSAAWGSTVTNGLYFVFIPVYLGSADNPWRRVYTGEGTGEGIRFGYGITAGGQNGLLFMDTTGDLYWRDKAGTPTKLN